MGRNIKTITYADAPEKMKKEVEALGELALNGWFFVAFGFDAPCGGYFIQIGWDCDDVENDEINNHPKFNGEYIELCNVGFFKGVSKNTILTAMETWGIAKLMRDSLPNAFDNLCMDLPC